MAGAYFICAVLSLVVGGIQASHSVNASSINSDFEEFFPETDTAVYDYCAIGQLRGSDDVEITGDTVSASIGEAFSKLTGDGTGWTFVWQFNAAIMIIMGVNYLVMIGGAFNYKARLGGTILNFVLGLLNLIGSCVGCCSISGLGAGAFCALNAFMISEYDGDGKFVKDGYTYADEGGLIQTFAIIQIVLGSCQIIYCGFPLFFTKVIPDDVKPKETGEKRKKMERHPETSSYSESESQTSQLESIESEPRQKKSKKIPMKSKSVRNTTISASVDSVDQVQAYTNNRRVSKKHKAKPATKNVKAVIHPVARNDKAVNHRQQQGRPQSYYNDYDEEEDDLEHQQHRRKSSRRKSSRR